jgi:hypothetical protein
MINTATEMNMKLGRDTNSMVNYLMSGNKTQPEVGAGATILNWTDRKPATVVEIIKFKNGKIKAVVVQEDDAKRIDDNGMSELQEYEYSRNSEGYRSTHKALRDGTFENLSIGEREKYYDFSF